MDALIDQTNPESPAPTDVVCKCGQSNAPGSKHCGKCGKWLPRNTGAETVGICTYERRGLIPDKVRDHEHAFRAQIVADLGGEENITAIAGAYVRHLVHLSVIIELLTDFLRVNGPLTPRGKQRSATTSLISALAAFDRQASRLGLQRRTKHISNSVEAYLRQHGIDTNPETTDDDDAE
jgi:hypothetical protein